MKYFYKKIFFLLLGCFLSQFFLIHTAQMDAGVKVRVLANTQSEKCRNYLQNLGNRFLQQSTSRKDSEALEIMIPENRGALSVEGQEQIIEFSKIFIKNYLDKLDDTLIKMQNMLVAQEEQFNRIKYLYVDQLQQSQNHIDELGQQRQHINDFVYFIKNYFLSYYKTMSNTKMKFTNYHIFEGSLNELLKDVKQHEKLAQDLMNDQSDILDALSKDIRNKKFRLPVVF